MNIPTYTEDGTIKIALIQPASWGDNINSTLMFKPLKAKYPNSIIDVYTANNYSSAFTNNPYINNIIEFPAHCKEVALDLLNVIPPHVQNRGYNMIFRPHPMLNGDKWTSIKHGELGTNLINAWVRALEENGIDYAMPLETILRLTDREVAHVNQFCAGIDMSRKKTIMEAGGESGQTTWDGRWTAAVVDTLCGRGETVFISFRPGAQDLENLAKKYNGLCHYVHHLSIRECAELFNRCDRFISVSSGLSNACNTNWCKKDIEWLEMINSEAVNSAPIRSTGKRFFYNPPMSDFLSALG